MDNVIARADRNSGRIIHYFGATPVSWIAAADIARVAAEVLRRPADFAGRVLPLATEARTMDEIAALVSDKSGRRTAARAGERCAATPLARLAGRLARPSSITWTRSRADVCRTSAAQRARSRRTGSPAIDWARFIDLNVARFA
jgi:uncharacterized protein YbjT (DUF2867 family)